MRAAVLLLLAALALAGCGKPNTGAPKPGSDEDCLAWAMAELDARPDDFQNRYRLTEMLRTHFQDGRKKGQKPGAIIARQEAIYRFSLNRPQRDDDYERRPHCLEKFSLPEAAKSENARR